MPQQSWLPVAAGSDFPIQNLPYGAYRRPLQRARLCVAIGDCALDLFALARIGLLDSVAPNAREIFCAENLGLLLTAGRPVWRAARERITAGLRSDATAEDVAVFRAALVKRDAIDMILPLEIPDYIDFYSSLEHATNVGKILRPGTEPLLPNWRYLPIGYHGKTSTIVAGGTSIARPCGQLSAGDDAPPIYAPTRRLDFELELGFVTGNGPLPARPISPREARDYIFGVALLCDWSARDIQAWEYRPLGPFLAKSFATSLAPWIVTLDALEPYRVAGPTQEPPALPYLRSDGEESFDIALEVSLTTATMRANQTAPQPIARTNFRYMYWSMTQQLAHASSNGARFRAGDLFGSGTISGNDPGSYGSLIELTWGGKHPLDLGAGETRAYLEDGDEVVMHGWCEAAEDRARIGFGELRGRIDPVTSLPESSPDR